MLKTHFCNALVSGLCLTIFALPGCAQQPEPAAKPTVAAARNQPLLHPLFSDNAVLQRDRAIQIWGWAAPNSTVNFKFDDEQQTAVAAADGRWAANLKARAAGGPHALEVSVAGTTIKRENIFFGDVWLCSGQSNMEWPVNAAKDAATEKADADHPQIRLLTIPHVFSETPNSTFDKESWQVCSPQTVGQFSAVAYFFGRKLGDELKVPIGLIDSSWGGTLVEAWTSAPALGTMEDFKVALANVGKDDGATAQQKLADWWDNDPGTKAHYERPDTDDSDWKTATLPGLWEQNGFANFDGVMWVRKTVDVPAEWANRALTLDLGTIRNSDHTFWNGARIGITIGNKKPSVYNVSAAQVKAGRNVIAVRVLNTVGDGGFAGPKLSLQNGGETVALDGEWKVKQGLALKDFPPRATEQTLNQHTPTALYNGMIAPLLPAQVKGVIWYQGEGNAKRAAQYRTLLPTLIKDWRARFGEPLPFHIVQLAGYLAPDARPTDGDWAYLREAQLLTSQTVPDTGLAVAVDIGEEKSIHPVNKQDVGLRLALVALEKTYGQKIESSGPTLKSFAVVGNAIQLRFDHAQGLNLKGEANRVFSVGNGDGQFFWAIPKIEGDTITIANAALPAPTQARFAWSNNPRAALYNEAGLPASPFRTDK